LTFYFSTERLSIARDVTPESTARLASIDSLLNDLQRQQEELSERWNVEKAGVSRLQEVKEQIDATHTAISKAEREFDLTAAATLKYGTLPGLVKQLKEEEEIYERDKNDRDSAYLGARMLRDTVGEASFHHMS
jgi:ATP-dependent Clp protease ATP-binding subunit ClpB